MGNWNKGLYQLGQRLGGTYLGSVGGNDTNSLLLLEHRGGVLAVHGYGNSGMMRGSMVTHTCVTQQVKLESPLQLFLAPKNLLEKWTQGKGESQIEQKFRVETNRKDAARWLLRSPALEKALLACPKTEVTLYPVRWSALTQGIREADALKEGEGPGGAVVHMLRVHTTYINEEWSWTDTATTENIYAIDLVERMVELARVICDTVLEYRL